MAETWWAIVRSEANRRAAISALRRPSATSASTSSSRAVSPAGLLERRAARALAHVARAALAQHPADARSGGPGAELLQLGVCAALRSQGARVGERERCLVGAADRDPGRGRAFGVARELEPEGLGNGAGRRLLGVPGAPPPEEELAGDPALAAHQRERQRGRPSRPGSRRPRPPASGPRRGRSRPGRRAGSLPLRLRSRAPRRARPTRPARPASPAGGRSRRAARHASARARARPRAPARALASASSQRPWSSSARAR